MEACFHLLSQLNNSCLDSQRKCLDNKDKLHWFSSIPQLGKYTELTPSQQQEEGARWISLTPVGGKYSINAKVSDVESF